ncbi:MAG: hypothetical protein DRO89_06270, partial [Candidatus Altiarchaeales archaeon]
PGVMDDVIAVRQAGATSMNLPETLPTTDGFIAVEDCSRIGEIVWMRHGGGDWESFLVADCSGHAETTDWMKRNGICAEVDYETAARWGVVGRGAEVDVFLGERIGYAFR